jgi:hypothetical protein
VKGGTAGVLSTGGFCHILALLFGDAFGMGREQTIRLRESATSPPRNTKVIDAEFEVIGRRTIWRRVGVALTALFWAAVIGFAVPQVWIFSQRIGEFFAQG